MRKRIIFISVLIFCLALPLMLKGASLNHPQFPKLANIFFRWDITEAEAKALAKWDMLIVDMEVQTYSPASLKLLKELNPDIKLLAYIASQEIRGDSGTLTGTLRQKLFNKINYQWWLKDVDGNKIKWWPTNPIVNITASALSVNNQRWQDVLPWFVKTELMDSGYWDGVFYDNVWDDLSFLSSKQIDLNQDGSAENLSELNKQWREGMAMLLKNTRTLFGPEKLIIGNGGDYYYQYLNGVLYEHFPKKGWPEMMKKYQFINDNGQPPAVAILNTNVDNTGAQGDYKKMRFGLASALLDDGYYSFDNGDQSHHEIWWYDEYETGLGLPAGQAMNVLNNSQTMAAGLWRRDFKNGLVLVNSSEKEITVDLAGEYEKLQGIQDPLVNDGSFVSSVDLASQDGLILLRPIEKIFNTVYANGSFARVYNQFGHLARTGFFVYNEKHKGGGKIIEQDLNADGLKETVIAGAGRIKVFESDGRLRVNFDPYGPKYFGGVNIAVADLDANGTMEIVTGTEKGAGPQVRIFDSFGKLINPGFFAYNEKFRGGVNVALADFNKDGKQEIIVGAGEGGGPHVRIFSSSGKLISPGFFAYDSSWRTGVNVAAGDIDGDGNVEIITGPGKGGAPQVRVFDKNGKAKSVAFYAFESASKSGVEVAATDIDADGKDEIIATTINVFTLAGMASNE